MPKLIFTAIMCLVIFKAGAQPKLTDPFDTATKHKDSLLAWYGEKQKDGRFRTEAGAYVSFNPKTGKVKEEIPAGNDEFSEMEKELDRTPEAQDELRKAYEEAGNDMKTYPIVQEAIKLYEMLKEESKNIITADIDWGDNDEYIGKKAFGQVGFQNLFTNYCSQIKSDYDDIIAYANKLKARQKARDFDLPPPPSADYFNCWGCDLNKRDLYDTAVAHYSRDYFKESSKRIKKIMGIMRDVALVFGYKDPLGGEGIFMENTEMLGSSKHPTPCTYLMDAPYQLREALYRIMNYEKERTWELFKKYKNDVTTIEPVTRVCLAIERQCQLLGWSEDTQLLGELAPTFYNLGVKWSEKLLKESDYAKIADIPFILGAFRSYVLMGGNEKSVDQYLEALVSFNRFKVFIDFSFRLGRQYIQSSEYHIEGYLNAVPKDSAGQRNPAVPCLHWVPAGHATGDKNMFLPVKLTSVGWSGPCFAYIGTHDFFTSIDMHIHSFCSDGEPDTLFLSSEFIPQPMGNYFWKTCSKPTIGWPMGAYGFGANLFQDPKTTGFQMAAEARSGELQKNIENVISMQTEKLAMAEKIRAMQQSGASREQIAAQLSSVLQKGNQAQAAASSVMQTAMIPFTLTFENKNKVPVNGGKNKFDAKSMNPTASPMIQLGIMTITIRHEPYNNSQEALGFQ